MTITWANVGALLSAVAGAIGTALVPIFGTHLASSVQAVVQAIAGLLLAIGAYHVTAVARTQAEAKIAQRPPSSNGVAP